MPLTDLEVATLVERYARESDRYDGTDPALANLRDVHCENQVVTIPDHVWNELEHDIKYKTPSGRPSPEQDALLKTLRGQLNLVRSTVEQLMAATDRQREANLAAIESPEDLRQALKARTTRSFTGDLGRLLDLLSETLRDVTRAELDKLPLDSADLSSAADRLRSAESVLAETDAGIVVAALWPSYAEDFVEVVASWQPRTVGETWRDLLVGRTSWRRTKRPRRLAAPRRGFV